MTTEPHLPALHFSFSIIKDKRSRPDEEDVSRILSCEFKPLNGGEEDVNSPTVTLQIARQTSKEGTGKYSQ
jgi:hypothetical protein